MSLNYKVVRDATGRVVCFGQNTEHYEPTVELGFKLTIESNIPANTFSRRAEIIEQLREIDYKCIRPISEGDAAYLAILREPVAALRAELAGL